MKEWLVKYIKDNEEACRNFLSHAGRAKDIDVAALAPASLPLEERLRRLYAPAQEKIGYDPNVSNLEHLSDVMREAQNSTGRAPCCSPTCSNGRASSTSGCWWPTAGPSGSPRSSPTATSTTLPTPSW